MKPLVVRNRRFRNHLSLVVPAAIIIFSAQPMKSRWSVGTESGSFSCHGRRTFPGAIEGGGIAAFFYSRFNVFPLLHHPTFWGDSRASALAESHRLSEAITKPWQWLVGCLSLWLGMRAGIGPILSTSCSLDPRVNYIRFVLWQAACLALSSGAESGRPQALIIIAVDTAAGVRYSLPPVSSQRSHDTRLRNCRLSRGPLPRGNGVGMAWGIHIHSDHLRFTLCGR